MELPLLFPLSDNDVHDIAPVGVSFLRAATPGPLTPQEGLRFTSEQHPIWNFYFGTEGDRLVAAAHTHRLDRVTIYYGDREAIRYFLRAMFKNRMQAAA